MNFRDKTKQSMVYGLQSIRSKRVICKLLFILLSTVSGIRSINAQSSTDIFLQLKKLKVLGSVLYVAAHPDDENNSFLPYLAKERKYRTAYLSLTRGDGGQNLIGSEQGIDLGLIRTEELLAARKMDGSEQYFTRAYEFGFSKSYEETLAIWNREKVLSDIVWVIRKYQPDVIINRFPPDARAGHGHHAASAVLSIEAYKAAADPNRFPEQLKNGVNIWKAKRLLWNTFNFGSVNTTSDNQLKLDAGVYNQLLGKNYGEIGGEARSMHKSQGEGRPRRKGPIMEYLTTIDGEPMKDDFMEGVNTDWSRLGKNGEIISSMIDNLIAQYNIEHPEYTVKGLIGVYKQVQQEGALADIWWSQKKKEIEELIIACSGFFAEAITDAEYGISGEKININFNINKRTAAPIQLDQVLLFTGLEKTFDTSIKAVLATNVNVNFVKSFSIEKNNSFSQPYWLKKSMADIGTFSVDDYMDIGMPNSKPTYTSRFIFSMDGISFAIDKPVQYKYVDPVRGEVYQPLNIITPIVVSLNQNVLLTHLLNEKKRRLPVQPIGIQFKSNITAANAVIQIALKENATYITSSDTTLNLEAGAVYSSVADVSKLFLAQTPKHVSAEVSITVNGQRSSFEHYLKAIKYDHIPSINYFYKDNLAVIAEPIIVVPKKLAYIIGAGDLVPEAIAAMGYELSYLTESSVTDEELKKYDAIMIGIRAHNIFEWLTNKNDILNRFIQNGGHLIVQYLKSNQVGNKRVKVGPFPFAMSGIRVTEENAAVNFLLPQHALLNYPNKIDPKDFEGWIQERSTYQMEPVTAPYESLLSMNDKGEKPTSGSFITAKYGKGNITYVSLALFRQLPAGVPGAYRLLANILALPSNK
jgi:LmbE family N-acetylglucosaminyl deacetylase